MECCRRLLLLCELEFCIAIAMLMHILCSALVLPTPAVEGLSNRRILCLN
jgi:hypothetical protein